MQETKKAKLKCTFTIAGNEEIYTVDISSSFPSLVSESVYETFNFNFFRFYIVL